MYKLFLRPTCTLLCGFAAMGAARAGTVSFHLDAGTLLMGAGLVCLLAWRLRSSFARRALAIALPLAAGLALSLPAIAQAVGVVHQVSDEEVAATIKYWTPERLAAAIPVPMPSVDAAAPRLATPNVQANARGEKPGFDPADAPRGFFLFRMPHAPAPVIPPWTGNCSDCTGDCDPYSSTFMVPEDDYVSYPADLPYIAIGKVFLTMGGLDYVCSGASIGGSAVLTAGHCVSDGQGNFDTNWEFVPDFYEFTSPVPDVLWVATQLMTFPEFLNNADIGRDVGFAIVKGYKGYTGGGPLPFPPAPISPTWSVTSALPGTRTPPEPSGTLSATRLSPPGSISARAWAPDWRWFRATPSRPAATTGCPPPPSASAARLRAAEAGDPGSSTSAKP